MPDNGTLRPGFAATQRSRVRRHPERAHYDRETVYAILDAAMMCHVGYVIDGLPYVTPILFWRDGDRLYWHGSSASHMLRAQREGIPVCLTVSHVDGLVLARCAFRHSLNYRAVMAFGTAHVVEDESEKEAGLNAFIERLYPGRTALMRPIAAQELKATMLLGRDRADRAACGHADPRPAGLAARLARARDRASVRRRAVRRLAAAPRPHPIGDDRAGNFARGLAASRCGAFPKPVTHLGSQAQIS